MAGLGALPRFVPPWHGVVIGTAAGAIGVDVGTTVKHIDKDDGSPD